MKPHGPAYVITCDRPLSEEQIAYMRATWQREYTGSLLVLPGGFKLNSPSLREWIELHTRGMTSRRWQLEVPARYVPVAELLPIQPEPSVLETPERRDLAHVVEIDGSLYLQDGHHRFFRARRAGNPWLLARVLDASS